MQHLLAILILLAFAFPSSAKKKPGKWKDVTVTVYNPTSAQCDDTPLVTSCNKHIDINLLKSGKLRWIAVSRDLLHHFPYGSSVYLWIGPGHPKTGSYIVRDTMNERWSNRIDILTYNERNGKWSGKIQLNP